MSLPVYTDDQGRQQSAASFFWTMGDILANTDQQPRFEPGMSYGNGNGLYGPSTANADVGYGQGGEVFVRGRSGQIGTQQGAGVAPTGGATLAGIPLLWIGIGVAVFLYMRK